MLSVVLCNDGIYIKLVNSEMVEIVVRFGFCASSEKNTLDKEDREEFNIRHG